MKTPKERAEELVNKYMQLSPTKMGDYSRIYYPFAKQCALIAVDEMIETAKITSSDEVLMGAIIYLQKVKQEIDKL